MILFALEETREWASRLAAHLGTRLASHEERAFEDGEFKIRSLEDVSGENVFVCESLAADETSSTSDKLLRLAFFCGSLADAGAARVTALIPYLAFARKDRRTKPRDPVATRYVASMLEAVGVGGVIALDVHSPAALDNAFRVPTRNLSVLGLFADHLAPALAAAERVVVVAPDAGAVRRARELAELLVERTGVTVDCAFVEKERSGGRVSGELFAGDVRGADVVVADDMIASGTTLARAAAACAARGARAIHAAATHAVLADGAARTLDACGLASLVVTDSVTDVQRRARGLRTPLHVLDSTPIFARALGQQTGRNAAAR